MAETIITTLVIIGAAIYFSGYAMSGVMAYRLKKWGWLCALLFLGPISYPFCAIINRGNSKLAYRCFWVGLVIIVFDVLLVQVVRPSSVPT